MTHSRRVDVLNVSLDDGIMNFAQTIDVHIRDITTCDPFDQFGFNTGYTYTSKCSDGVILLKSRDVINLLNSIDTTMTNVTIYSERWYTSAEHF